ncbi:hypothetical protein SLS56_003934 [Neofusicoccum ribis]|uniref:Uncharacterized protein n=1 Tax=Neofusicoccum ribis TaxID=45134 RepID=A0ABR3SXX1_9PEZI
MTLPGDAGPAAAAAAAATASPGPASPRVPLAESSSPSTPDAAGGEQDEENEELPMTMAASVLLTSLPKDAKSALEGAGMEVFRRGKEGEFEKGE